MANRLCGLDNLNHKGKKGLSKFIEKEAGDTETNQNKKADFSSARSFILHLFVIFVF